MRQRLGIATALIGEPEVLILGEPANGLDPAGIRWMRGLLRDYADRGGTVLLSSHLLHEIEVVLDDLVVIGNGRIVAARARSDLLRSAGSTLRTPDRQVVAHALLEAGITFTPAGPDGLLATRTPPRSTPPGATSQKDQSHDRHRHHSRSHSHRGSHSRARSPHRAILARILTTELRKMFDTRSRFWLMAGIGILALLATGAVIAFSADAGMAYSAFVCDLLPADRCPAGDRGAVGHD
jgi:ABC-type multidrug transport system ATPase subunit